MIRGFVKFEDPGALPRGQNVTLTVQDTSRVGADAIKITQKQLRIPEGFDATNDTLPFEIDVSGNIEDYTIRAHLARHSGDDIRLGDMITTGAIPLSGAGHLEVLLKQVR
ncbi:hypothetical protein CEP88_16470 [Roseobacter denitrificans]|uniref:Lipoprotein n=1 Tax=Roseobacter denitrificans (strain ATCC 33942 / OCh 114) TaxID=375451 RepID=Q16AP8_ROSDO|nr:YbaY family lipoprotein [Roseobacter denitrificans]ABG30945.1 hypothetical protein RD1_1300 [Roseobacter denitrificans OCh 114]AVL54033.1 hypothetical protein CEP88_16470 [Roseobacter denitrificans]SFG13740.1 hypothetical protein SAMN05443635_10892 [Roseobacter denitrificans OCh 114]